MDFCTLGMYITDDIYPAKTATDQTPRLNIVGGAGTYSAIGARLLSPPPLSRSVGWIVDAGTDFPVELRHLIESWETGVVFRPRDVLTTRGWNGYGENDFRGFKYLTEKKRLTADDLTDDLLCAKSFHLICSASRCEDLVKAILQRRQSQKSLFIWEPVPDLCVPSEMAAIQQALHFVDVISPNHDELGTLFNHKHGANLDKAIIEQQAVELLKGGIGKDNAGCVVVRAGKDGCFVASNQVKRWVPAYHTRQADVVDPTGGGNGFLGGFAVGLVRASQGQDIFASSDLIEACIQGSIAASFCIEQVGPPVLTKSEAGELWNNCDVAKRLNDFRGRISAG